MTYAQKIAHIFHMATLLNPDERTSNHFLCYLLQ